MNFRTTPPTKSGLFWWKPAKEDPASPAYVIDVGHDGWVNTLSEYYVEQHDHVAATFTEMGGLWGDEVPVPAQRLPFEPDIEEARRRVLTMRHPETCSYPPGNCDCGISDLTIALYGLREDGKPAITNLFP